MKLKVLYTCLGAAASVLGLIILGDASLEHVEQGYSQADVDAKARLIERETAEVVLYHPTTDRERAQVIADIWNIEVAEAK